MEPTTSVAASAAPITPPSPIVPAPTPVAETTGWMHGMQTKISEFFSGLPTYASDILIFGPLGMLFGFLAKIMGRYFVFAVLVAIIGAWIGMHYGIITFDVEKLKALIGMSPTITFGDVVSMMFAWMKEHIAGCIAIIVGFIVGWKIGK